jgi:hypothetical protein
MAKREKIIIIVMIVAILYGVYSFFLTSPPEAPVENEAMGIETLNNFVVGAAQELFSEKSITTDGYILNQAQAEWTQDPCYVSGDSLSSQRAAKVVDDPSQKIRLAYTGYIEVADKRLAIINDLEYETGEQLNQPGYYVKLITSRRVVLGVDGAIENIILPLEEQ